MVETDVKEDPDTNTHTHIAGGKKKKKIKDTLYNGSVIACWWKRRWESFLHNGGGVLAYNDKEYVKVDRWGIRHLGVKTRRAASEMSGKERKTEYGPQG